MRQFFTIAVAALAATLTLGGAFAADAITVPTSSADAIPVSEGGFDWSGFYAGVFAGAQRPGGGDTQLGLGIQAGINAQFDFYLVGLELAVQGLSGSVGETSYGQILGRAGLVVTDDVLVYAAGGYGIDLGPSQDQNVLIGGGVELAVTDIVTVDAQYLHGFPTDGGAANDQFTIGANFHF
ncbi:porin family protein [Devosia sp. 2618]|uniref:outer membrane protein n=1 Tax=Devosia sp. 2618 TaxID=3156454 RepID=UPI003390D295